MLVVLAATASEAANLTVLLILAAGIGAALATVLRIPRLVGYLAAGVVAGPAGFNLVDDPDHARFVADLGVALLLFLLGVELSLRELYANLRRAALIGLGQICLVGLAAGAGAALLGFSASGAVLVGSAVSLSSTAAGLLLLGRSGEQGRAIAPLVAGILIFQALAALVLVVALPSLDDSGATSLVIALLAMAGGLVAVALMVPVGAVAMSFLLERVASRVDRELFLIVLVAAIGLVAAVTTRFGLSIALGALVAGLIVSHSGFASQALREIDGFARVFAALFFVSAGLLIDPDAIGREPGLLVVLLIAAAPLKAAVLVGLARAFGIGWRPALVLGLILGTAGEFTFVVAEVADPDILAADGRSVVLATMVISLITSGILISFLMPAGMPQAPAEETRVTVIGYGRLGRAVAFELARQGLPPLIIEREPSLARLARDEGFAATWANASRPSVARAAIDGRVVVVTPAGHAGKRLVAEFGRLSPPAKVISTSTTSSLSQLGLDLTIVEVDRPGARAIAEAVVSAASRPLEPFTVRSGSGVARFAATGRGSTRSRIRSQLEDWFRPPVTDPARCQACDGTGRRHVGLHFTDCAVCGGTGGRPLREGAAGAREV